VTLKAVDRNTEKGGLSMDWQIILAIVVAIPVILVPAVLVWYLNVSGTFTVIRETRKRRITREKRMKAAVEIETK
jgi:uncharacterized membrane protein YqiK